MSAREVECTWPRCRQHPRLKRLSEGKRSLLARLWARLDDLDDQTGPLAKETKKNVRKAIEALLSS